MSGCLFFEAAYGLGSTVVQFVVLLFVFCLLPVVLAWSLFWCRGSVMSRQKKDGGLQTADYSVLIRPRGRGFVMI